MTLDAPKINTAFEGKFVTLNEKDEVWLSATDYAHAVVVKDPTDLVHHLHAQMGFDIHETILKIGIDDGRVPVCVIY